MKGISLFSTTWQHFSLHLKGSMPPPLPPQHKFSSLPVVYQHHSRDVLCLEGRDVGARWMQRVSGITAFTRPPKHPPTPTPTLTPDTQDICSEEETAAPRQPEKPWQHALTPQQEACQANGRAEPVTVQVAPRGVEAKEADGGFTQGNSRIRQGAGENVGTLKRHPEKGASGLRQRVF